jgi:hypothetical protein
MDDELDIDEGTGADVPDFPPVAVSGDFVDRVNVVNSTNFSTVMTFGELDGTPVLLPFVDWSVQSSGVMESKLLTFENLAFVIAKMANDYARVCGEVVGLIERDLRSEDQRMSYAEEKLGDAIRQLELARSRLSAARPQ